MTKINLRDEPRIQPEILIGFGANLGRRTDNINLALRRLAAASGIELKGLSSLYETDPVGYLDQAVFLNGVARLESSLTPELLLKFLMEVEHDLGRVREQRWGPRVIDLDILFYGPDKVTEADLVIPHPEIGKRLFVMQPLAEILPGFSHPDFSGTVRDWLADYLIAHPDEKPGRLVAAPVSENPQEVRDGIFYRYG